VWLAVTVRYRLAYSGRREVSQCFPPRAFTSEDYAGLLSVTPHGLLFPAVSRRFAA
jgi:hypothetical protein